jgi:hypothetical protein
MRLALLLGVVVAAVPTADLGIVRVSLSAVAGGPTFVRRLSVRLR